MDSLGYKFAARLLPHGITELLAVCLCGWAGFKVGFALLFPGRARRLDSLARQGREAGAVIVGTGALPQFALSRGPGSPSLRAGGGPGGNVA